MPTKFPHLVLIAMRVLSMLVEYEYLVEYTDTTGVGMGCCQHGAISFGVTW